MCIAYNIQCTCTIMYIHCTYINCLPYLLKDVVKLQEENTSLKSGFELLKEHTTQQTKSLEVSLSYDIHVPIS